MTFSAQNSLPSLPVPDLNTTLDRYFRSASVHVSGKELEELKEAVEEFRRSPLSRQLHDALVKRSKEYRNWLEDWWFDAYLEIRAPIIPYISLAAIQPRSPAAVGMQLHRAADATHHFLKFWEDIRHETLPITKSRGVVWDMHQYYNLFNANRTPAIRKDRIDRYFRTDKEEGCPTHIVVLCRGEFWRLEVVDDAGEIISPDAFYHAFKTIQDESRPQEHSVSTLTTEERDTWAKMRTHLEGLSSSNAAALREVESAIFVLALSDYVGGDDNENLVYCMLGDSRLQWADKSVCLQVYRDSRITTQADHSNVDAIVVLDAGNTSGKKIRREKWTPREVTGSERRIPSRIQFSLDRTLRDAIDAAEEKYQQKRHSVAANVIYFKGYGNDVLRQSKIYGDTIIQIALQLAFAKTHGKFAPIYETASARKFFHGRTETVRGCTHELKAFGEAVLTGKSETEQAKLFKTAYDTHNRLMAEATEGEGIDRHLFGLRQTLNEFNKGACAPKQPVPRLFTQHAWRASGGDGNFLLSTSFLGYDSGGNYGYVTAMCDDGYGIFYKANTDSLTLTTTAFTGTKSNLKEYGRNLEWALSYLHRFFPKPQAKV